MAQFWRQRAQQDVNVRKYELEWGYEISHILILFTCSYAYDFLSLQSSNFTWSSNMIISTMT
jgi:cytochrome c oxidase subunit IV